MKFKNDTNVLEIEKKLFKSCVVRNEDLKSWSIEKANVDEKFDLIF